MPVLISSSNAQWQNGDTLPEICKVFPNEPIYRCTGIINCCEDLTFRKVLEDSVEKIGRRHIIIAGVTIGTRCAWNRYEVEAAMTRMANAGCNLLRHLLWRVNCRLTGNYPLPMPCYNRSRTICSNMALCYRASGIMQMDTPLRIRLIGSNKKEY